MACIIIMMNADLNWYLLISKCVTVAEDIHKKWSHFKKNLKSTDCKQ